MTRRFNLLPHRELKRQWSLRVLGRQVFLATVTGALLALLGSLAIDHSSAYLSAYNQVLNTALVERALPYSRAQKLLAERAALIEKKAILERVDARRTTSVLIMNDVIRARPEGLFLTRFEENGDQFRLEGQADTAASIARFFEQMNETSNVKGLVLEEVQLLTLSSGTLYEFSMHGKVHLFDAALAAGADLRP